MEATLELFIQEINKIEDAEELRRRLIDMKKEIISLQNRESEYLRTQEETALLFQQTTDELKGVKAENKELRKELSKYKDKNALDRNRLFGRQTEKTGDLLNGTSDSTKPEDPLSEDAKPESSEGNGTAPSVEGKQPDGTVETEGNGQAEVVGKKTKKTGGKKTVGKHKKDLSRLPQREVYDYHPNELDDQYGAGNWRLVSWHASTKKEVIPAIVYAKTTYTPVISVGLEHEMISVPPSEKNLFPGSDATASLVAYVMDRKFTLGLPTYRQEAEFERSEIGISRQTMSNWILHFSKNAFEQVYGHLADILKKSGCTQCDETTLLVIRDGRKAGRKSYLWIHVTSELGNEHPITVICYEPDRSTRHLREFFEGYAGEIVCDAYSAYQTFETENGDTVIICGCWMHSRRRWAEALRVRNVSGLSLKQIEELPEARALYLIADIYKEEGKLKGLSANERLQQRQLCVKPKVEAYYEFLATFDLNDPGLSERTKDAIQYSLNQKEYLCRFLERGSVPMDNGNTERKAKSLAIGRGNWMFCTSPRGAKALAIMYTLVETAKSNGADVYFYLKYLLEKAPTSPNLIMGKKYLDELMPWSEAYRKYEKEQKQMLLDICLPPSEVEPTGKKLMRYMA